MKKILFFACLAMVMVGCDGGKEKPEESTNSNTLEGEAVAPDKIEKYNKYVRGYLPTAVAPIDKIKVDALVMSPSWKVANKNYIVLETTNRYYIDLDIVYYIGDIVTWMGTNDENIVFSEFYNSIELRHKVIEQDTLNYNAVKKVNDTVYKNIKYSDLIAKLTHPSVAIAVTDQYDNLFKVTTSGGIAVTKTPYSFSDAVYSIPLINAIKTNHNLSNPTFSFATANIDGTTVTFFRVKEGAFEGFYDYSHVPPMKFAEL